MPEPYEDFTDFTEVDPNTHLTVAKNHLDFVAYRNEDCYLYEDLGADFIDDFVHEFDVYMSSESLLSIGYTWGAADNINDMKGIADANQTFIGVYCYSSTNYIYLEEYYDGTGYDDSYNAAGDTWYYLRIEKSGTSLTCKIFSDRARTTLVDTLSLTLQADHTLRYLYAANTWNSGNALDLELDIDNLDIHTLNADYEDFESDYTEVDTNSVIEVFGNTIHYDSARDETGYVYKDFGAAYFGDFSIHCQSMIYSGDSACRGYFCCMNNTLEDMQDAYDANRTAIGIEWYGSTPTLALVEIYSGTAYSDTANLAVNTEYYFTFEKFGRILCLKIYSDAARTTLVDTLGIWLHADHEFRYFYGVNSADDGTASQNCKFTTRYHNLDHTPSATVEDLTTYTEVDPNTHLTIRGTGSSYHESYQNEDCYLYKDFGTDNFSDFTHDFKMGIAANDDNGVAYPWSMQNVINDNYYCYSNNETVIMVDSYDNTAAIRILEYYDGSAYADSYIGMVYGIYYLRIEKSGTSFTAKIYSDAERTDLLDTLSLTLQADHSFRYLYAANTWNDGTSEVGRVYAGEYATGEAAEAMPKGVYYAMMRN